MQFSPSWSKANPNFCVHLPAPRGILETAVTDELIGRNPCMVKGAGQERSPERPMVSIAEVEALAAAMPEPWRIAVELAAWCHLRLGEVLGLERRDIDLLHATVRVERTAHEVGGRLELGPPKTAAGLRIVSISAPCPPSHGAASAGLRGSRAVFTAARRPEGRPARPTSPECCMERCQSRSWTPRDPFPRSPGCGTHVGCDARESRHVN